MIRIIEDGAGGLWLSGEIVDGTVIAGYGNLQGSGFGITDMLAAYWDGIDSWEHDQDNDLDAEPAGQVVATYDGTDIVLYVSKMGYAAREYLCGRDSLAVLARNVRIPPELLPRHRRLHRPMTSPVVSAPEV